MSAVNNATAPTTAATVGPVNYALSAASYIGQYVPPSAGNGAFPKPPVAPPISNAVSYEVASKATQRLIAASLRDAGFSAAHPDAARWIEVEMVALLEKLYQGATEYANLAARTRPTAVDMTAACTETGMPVEALRPIAAKASRKRKRGTRGVPGPLSLTTSVSRSPSPELLPSDDEGSLPVVPATLRGLPVPVPKLPPKHTYLRTPASPPKRAAIPTLDKKLKTAALVQESLRNLLVATDDNSGQGDAELLGHIVNWEASVQHRKRWKIGSSV